jgi:DNA-binding NarL/FixJ family response regulator
MPPNSGISPASVLFIDDSKGQRAYWADQLKSRSSAYEILEASDGESGLRLYRSRQIDCVVFELILPDQSGFEVLLDLVPVPSRPRVAAVVLTEIPHPSVWGLTLQNGAYACLCKHHATGEDLDNAIQRAIAFVAQVPKKGRDRPL